jgi:hypothetical protein
VQFKNELILKLIKLGRRHTDRGRLYQHLMSSKMKKNRLLIANYFWTYGEDSAFNASKGLCNRLGYLLSEQGQIRGENVRDLELPDFFV